MPSKLAIAALIAGAAAQAPLVPEAQWGTFAVMNHCDFDLYLWSVSDKPGPMITLPKGSPWIGYKEQYRPNPNGGGISLKVSPNYAGPAGANGIPSVLTQLEYTVPSQTDPAQASVRNLIFYDISWVNGDPLAGIPMTMQTSNPGVCASGTCGADQPCNVGYEWSTDDTKTHSCGLEQNVLWTFCPTTGGSLASNIVMGPLGRRSVEERDAQSNDDALNVCIQIGPNGQEIEGECSEGAATSVAAQAPTQTPSALAAVQVTASTTTTTTPTPTPTTTTTPQTVSTAAPASNKAPSEATGSFSLTDIDQTGVTVWYSFDNQQISKREVSHSHHGHRHSHQAFHRRNRIIKNHSA